MPRKKTVTTEDKKDLTVTTKEVVATSFTQAIVKDKGGHVERVYSLEKHGKDFATLAQEYVSKPKRTQLVVEYI